MHIARTTRSGRIGSLVLDKASEIISTPPIMAEDKDEDDQSSLTDA
jgi:hypothetical protein